MGTRAGTSEIAGDSTSESAGKAGSIAALILAAGQGTRMKSRLAKVLHPIAGRPMLAYSIAAVEASWTDIFAGNPYDYFFLDDFFDQQYQADRQFGEVFGFFALLAILVACLGLFGLTAFSVQQRTKEIGIRKVLGASAPGIVGLLSKEYALLVLLANALAWPVTYLVMQRWLQTFVYHIDPGVFTLLLASAVALLIAGLTVSYHTLRAAHTNPVEALRYE